MSDAPETVPHAPHDTAAHHAVNPTDVLLVAVLNELRAIHDHLDRDTRPAGSDPASAPAKAASRSAQRAQPHKK